MFSANFFSHQNLKDFFNNFDFFPKIRKVEIFLKNAFKIFFFRKCEFFKKASSKKLGGGRYACNCRSFCYFPPYLKYGVKIIHSKPIFFTRACQRIVSDVEKCWKSLMFNGLYLESFSSPNYSKLATECAREKWNFQRSMELGVFGKKTWGFLRDNLIFFSKSVKVVHFL